MDTIIDDIDNKGLGLADPQVQKKLMTIKDKIKKEIKMELRMKEGMENLKRVNNFIILYLLLLLFILVIHKQPQTLNKYGIFS